VFVILPNAGADRFLCGSSNWGVFDRLYISPLTWATNSCGMRICLTTEPFQFQILALRNAPRPTLPRFSPGVMKENRSRRRISGAMSDAR